MDRGDSCYCGVSLEWQAGNPGWVQSVGIPGTQYLLCYDTLTELSVSVVFSYLIVTSILSAAKRLVGHRLSSHSYWFSSPGWDRSSLSHVSLTYQYCVPGTSVLCPRNFYQYCVPGTSCSQCTDMPTITAVSVSVISLGMMFPLVQGDVGAHLRRWMKSCAKHAKISLL